jgi:hypothetical protein
VRGTYNAPIREIAFQLNGGFGIRLDGGFNAAILETSLEGIVAEFAGKFGARK